MPAPNYRQLARDFAIAVGLNPDIYERQINQESGFNPTARSGVGAQGIAQIMPATAKAWGVDPRDPVASLKVAAQQMANYVKTYKAQGNDETTAYKLALAAYNGGTGGANYLKKTNFAIEPNKPSYAWGNQTARYVQNIMGGTQPQQVNPKQLAAPPQPKGPTVNANDILKKINASNQQISKTLGSYTQFANNLRNQPKSNPMGALFGGIGQGATAFAYRPQIAPQDAGWQTAGNIIGSLAPIGIGALTGGPLGAAAGAGAVAAGADIYRQDMEAAAGLRKNFNFASPLIQGGLGAALAPVPFAAKGMGLLPRAALGAGVGAVTGAAGPAVEMATDPTGATTGADVARAALMGAGIGAAGAGLFVPGKGRIPTALNAAANSLDDPLPAMVNLPGRKFLQLPSVSSATPPLRLPGGVEVPTAGPRGGVMLRENRLPLPEVTVQEGAAVTPQNVLQGEVMPPDVPMVQPEPVPIPEVIQRAVSDASQFGEYPVYMTKGAANAALKATEVPSTIVQDGKRYRVLPKGSVIPEYTSIFERGQTIDFNGESARVIGEPFGQVELRLSDGSIRLVPRETVLDYISKTSYAGGANDTTKVLSKAQKIETERRQVSTILSELTQTETDSVIANEFFQNRDLKPKNEPDIATGGKNWQSIKLGGKKLIYQADDSLVKALERFRAQGLDDPTSALERVVMRTGGLDSLTDEAQLIRKKVTTGGVAASSEDIFALQEKQLKQELNARDAIENAAFDNAAREADNILAQLDIIKTMEEWDTLANRVDDIIKMTPENVVAKLETKLNESLAKVSQQEPVTPEPPVVKDLTQPDIPTQPTGRPSVQERLNTYFKESGFTGVDEAKIAKSLQRVTSEKGLAKKAKELGIDLETAQRLKQGIDATDENIKALLNENFDPQTGIGQQRVGREVQLNDPSISELVSGLSPKELEIARIAEQAMQQDRPMVTEFAKEISGGTSGTAGGRGGEIATETPIGFVKSGKDLALAVYNEDGGYRVRKLIPDSETSKFISTPRVLSNMEPIKGPYANVYKPLGQFDVNTILDRLPAEAPILSSDLQKTVEFSQRIAQDTSYPESMRRFAKELLDSPTPRTARRMISRFQMEDESTVRRFMDDAGIRC